MHKLLENYIGIVEFLGEFLGEDTEVVLHDVVNLEKSIVAIKNNHISGREIGAPATNLVLKILKNKEYKDKNYLSNYKGTSKTGKILKSATYFIKDEQNEVIGMLCINIDIDKMNQLKSFIDKIVMFDEDNNQTSKISETLSQSTKELTFDNIYKVVDNFGIPAERMSQEEKIQIIEELNDKGIFLIKGAVSEAANALKVSEASIYRYLSKIKKK